jgi:hypothetical protein
MLKHIILHNKNVISSFNEKKKHIWNCNHIFWSLNEIKGKSLKIKKVILDIYVAGSSLKGS